VSSCPCSSAISAASASRFALIRGVCGFQIRAQTTVDFPIIRHITAQQNSLPVYHVSRAQDSTRLDERRSSIFKETCAIPLAFQGGAMRVFPCNPRERPNKDGKSFGQRQAGPRSRNAGCAYSSSLFSGPLHGYAITSFIRRQSDDALLVEKALSIPLCGGWRANTCWRPNGDCRRTTARPSSIGLTNDGRRQLRQETKTWEAYAIAVAKVLSATQPQLPEESA